MRHNRTHARALNAVLSNFKKHSEGQNVQNTPGTAGGPGGRDRTLAVKSRKTLEFFLFCIYLLVIPKYWGKQI